MARRTWLLMGLLVLVVAVLYLVDDWTRPCAGGPVKQLVSAALHGGAYSVRCAG